jgi:prepilin-type N-terminal cleavage/methylation domain-containing protein
MADLARPRLSTGFTLLEIIVALAVLGLLIVALASGVRLGMDAWNRQEASVASRADLDATDRTIRRLITQMQVPSAAAGGTIEGTEHVFAFETLLPESVAVASRQATVALSVDKTHRLVLRWQSTPHENRAVPAAEVVTRLLPGIDHVDFAYWEEVAGDGVSGWRTEWHAASLPKLVRVRLFYQGDTVRRWPDIVVAPLVEGGSQ